MVYADTDFFLALLKEEDWLQESARKLLHEHKGKIWTSSATLIELLLVADEFNLGPERLVADVLKIAQLKASSPNEFIMAAHNMAKYNVTTFDALHAAFCGNDTEIISSDKVFDRLGLTRIPLEG